jgi:hypothetical protein
MGYTINIRSKNWELSRLLTSSLRRRVPELGVWVGPLMRFEVGMGSSPIIVGGRILMRLSLKYKRERDKLEKGLKCYATTEYLNKHVDHKLLKVAEIAPEQVKKLMLEASYAKTMRKTTTVVSVRSVDTLNVQEFDPRYLMKQMGLLEAVFPFTYFQGILDDSTLRRLLIALGYDTYGDIRNLAWTRPGHTLVSDRRCPWSVLSMYSKCVGDAGSIRTRYPVFV